MHCHSLVLRPSWGSVCILGTPFRGVLRVLRISSTFPPTATVPTTQQNLLYQIRALGFVYYLEIANQTYLDVRAHDGDTLL